MIFFVFITFANALEVAESSPYLISEVKNERGCNASNIFASVSSFESAYATNGNYSNVINFSEQSILSNCPNCLYGNPEDVFRYMVKEGIYREPVYPYFGERIELPNTKEIPVKLPYFYNMTIENSDEFYEYLEKYPIVVGFRIDNLGKFIDYEEGVYHCVGAGNGNTHYMLAVFDVGSKENNYVLLKNNWGLGWGTNGYMMLDIQSNITQGPCAIFENTFISSFTKIIT